MGSLQSHVLSHRADVVVLLPVVMEVLRKERVVSVLFLMLDMEHVELDVWCDAVVCHELVVLLTAVSRVGDVAIAKPAVSVAEGFLIGDVC